MVGGRGKIKEDYWCWLSPVAAFGFAAAIPRSWQVQLAVFRV
jgi:hypothetical protein